MIFKKLESTAILSGIKDKITTLVAQAAKLYSEIGFSYCFNASLFRVILDVLIVYNGMKVGSEFIAYFLYLFIVVRI